MIISVTKTLMQDSVSFKIFLIIFTSMLMTEVLFIKYAIAKLILKTELQQDELSYCSY